MLCHFRLVDKVLEVPPAVDFASWSMVGSTRPEMVAPSLQSILGPDMVCLVERALNEAVDDRWIQEVLLSERGRLRVELERWPRVSKGERERSEPRSRPR